MGYIGLKTIAFGVAEQSDGNSTTGDGTNGSSTVLTWTPGILVITTGLVCYYMSCLACKLLMQRVSFCLPVCLAPITVAVCVVLQASNVFI